MNTDAIKRQLTGAGPFVIRTSDGREFTTTHGDFVGCTPRHVIIENGRGAMEILPSESVVTIAATGFPDNYRDHGALLNGYAPEDEGLYDDVLRG
jgi:hypothetical protein